MVSSIIGCLVASIFLATSNVVQAQNLISVDVPKVNEVIYNKEVLNITYTVIGTQTVSPPLTDYYPSSMAIDFLWTEHSNTANTLKFEVVSGLQIVPYTGGSQNVQRIESWKVPNCHFFSRYPPNTYDFSLVFTPTYPEVTESSPATGTTQEPIVVPVSVTVDNSTYPKC